ncbi:uncharacterized protein [Triticum aestivum]|uniref:uncharacterized protein isoform X3 n=1 Tax=Triticum aestivum TaxID=4565 RepID=UPI001ABD1DD3|nr:uncharacterized protein LOC123169749 isoform X3 [Triticum aestivum]XP_044443549.1 uncharacterized protein LOC123169749 isoform X3 [Triticum aestivum]XP_044443550.1 uncharacterized protein LOC123169749 isoform X3 [Triticum aestivum]
MEGPPAGVDEEIHHRQPEVIRLSMLLLQRRTPWLPFHPHTHWPSQNVTLCVVVGYDLIKVSEQLCKSDLDIPIKSNLPTNAQMVSRNW